MKRVLHVVMSLDTGGVETWLLHVLRALDREQVAFDFAVVRDEPGVYEAEVRRLGANVFRLGGEGRPLRWMRRLREVLLREGPYDAVHGHLHHLSGFALATAAAQRVSLRISHAHNDSRAIDAHGSFVRKAVRTSLKAAVRRFGTHHLAVSEKAALSLHGQGWEGRVGILPCALDFGPFATEQEPLREELGIPADAPVLGTVGRLAKEKNHAFLLEVLQALSASLPEARLLLVGDGPERHALVASAASMGLGGRVVFTGQRQDVARAMAMMDVFLFPSHFEGLGLAALESQAAGLPTVISTGVAEEVVVVDHLVRRLPLSDGPGAWAEAALAMLGTRGDRHDALRRIDSSPYGMATHLPRLLATYGVGESGE